MKINMDFGGIMLAVLNRRSPIKIYFSGSTKHRWIDLNSKPVLRCERLAAILLSHGENRTEVLEEKTVLVPPCPLQFLDGLTYNRTRAFCVRHRNLTA